MGAVGDRRGAAAADRLCEACVELLAVDGAALSLVFDGANTGTLRSSDTQARAYDELQFALGEGPCLESVLRRAPFWSLIWRTPNARAQVSFSAYGTAMPAYGVRGVFAMPVVLAGQYLGALHLFRSVPGALGPDDLAGALVAAELPLLDLLDTDLQAAATDPDSYAWAELNAITRAEVSQATGMLVGRLNVDPTEAWCATCTPTQRAAARPRSRGTSSNSA